MTIFDFSTLSTSSTWSDANFLQDTVNMSQLGSNASGGAGTGCVVPAAVDQWGRALYQGQTWGNTITAQIRVQGARGWPVTDDGFAVFIAVEDAGADQWKGYYWRCSIGNNALRKITDPTADISDAGSGTTVASGAGITPAENDVFKLVFNTSTGSLVCTQNATQMLTGTDTSYTSNLAPGFYASWSNHGGSGINMFIGEGQATGGSSRFLIGPRGLGGGTQSLSGGINS